MQATHDKHTAATDWSALLGHNKTIELEGVTITLREPTLNDMPVLVPFVEQVMGVRQAMLDAALLADSNDTPESAASATGAASASFTRALAGMAANPLQIQALVALVAQLTNVPEAVVGRMRLNHLLAVATEVAELGMSFFTLELMPLLMARLPQTQAHLAMPIGETVEPSEA
jgi:hypothetical protein